MKVEARGKGQASRQVNKILTPDIWSHADKICCVEIVTPDGNWSSYPPHKHDSEGDG